MENQMLCYQCGLAKNGKCCNDTVGACGKSAETSRLQDELTGALVGLAKASVNKSIDENIQRLVVDGLAATAAHTNFDDRYLVELTEQVKAAKSKYVPKFGSHNTSLKLPEDFDIRAIWQKSPDIRSLKSLLLFGIRGIALYAAESWALGQKNREAATYFHKALIALGANHFKEDYYDLLSEMGGVALRAAEQANKARTSAYGQPGPVEVPRVIEPGPFIIVSGHNFEVLGQILEQTKDSGVNIYSHGEMLPAHAYPEFRKFRHFKGHYGTSWQNQQSEFDCIPAAIVFTSGCMSLPLPSYIDRVFTAGNARIGGVPHLEKDFTPALIRSIEMGGAPEQITFPGINGGTMIRTGFGKKSLRTISYKLAAALKEDNLKHIYVLGGCDGKEANRHDYTEQIRSIPTDAVVLTWGCTKYRFNDIDFGAIDGVPRIIDLGMCSDLSLVIETVEAIAESAKLRVDELPLTWNYTWQEDRSVAQIFALFAADVQKVVLGPTLPPFFTEEVFRTVTKDYGMTLIETDSPTDTADYVPVFAAAKAEAEAEAKAEAEAEAKKAMKKAPSAAIPTPVGVAQQVSYTPEELEDRSEAAGLPAWAMADDEDEEEEEEIIVAEEEPAAPKIRPEDLDQSPAWLSAEDDEDDIAAIPEEAPMDIEARSEAAGLPAWAMEDDDDEEDFVAAEEEIPAPVGERTASFAEILALREEKGEIEEDEIEEEVEEEPIIEAIPAEPIKKEIIIEDTPVNYTMNEDAPKIVIPKGKGVSGWKDPDDEPAFKPGERKPYVYTPQKELVEIPQPPPISLPEGAGISGYAANHEGDSSADNVIKNNNGGGLYAFAEAQPEIKIPKGKGVSGWKESDDEIKPVKKSGGDEGSNAKPWLKQSLEKLHAEVEEANAPATPIPPAVPATPAPAPAAQGQTVAETPAPVVEEPAAEEHSDKPWLAASIKQLKESIAADEAAEANKNSDKPWLAASLSALHAEVEAEAQKNGAAPATAVHNNEEENEEVYVSNFKHDPATAADKPWLKSSIEELKNSIDAEAGIKSVRAEKKIQSQAISADEASTQWQDTAAPKSWKDITPAAEGSGNTAAQNTAAPTAPANAQPTDEPSGGGEPDAMWQKPARTPKPWDQNLTKTWTKPEVMPKPWEDPNATSYHTSADDRGIPKEQVIPNIPLGNPLMQQQRLAQQQAQQQALAQQQAQQAAFEAQQRAIAEQQAQQQALAQQQAQQAAIEAQQRAIAEQQAQQQAAYEAQQRALAEQQAQQQAAMEAQQRAIAEQQARQQQAAMEAHQRAAAEQQAQWQAQQQALARQQEEVRRQQQAAMEAEQRANAARQGLEQQAEQLRAAQQAQQAYAAQLQEQSRSIEAARAAQEQQAMQLEQQAQQLNRLRQQQQQQLNQQSLRNHQEQAAYAAQLEQQAQQLRAAQEQQAAYRAQLDQQAARMRAAQQAQAQQQQQLAQQEQLLRQQQQAAANPYQFGNGQGNDGPMTIPQGAGVSGYRQSPTFIPGQERPQANINDTIQPLANTPQGMANIPANGGISGSRYHESLPPIQTDYSATYGVPQPQITQMPHGVGVSGWADPNAHSVSRAQPAHTNFFGFMNSDAPAGVRSNTEVITPGSGDEFIATKGPDGEVTVTIKSK